MNSNKSSPNTSTAGAKDEILKLDDLAVRLRVHKSTLYRMIKNGDLPHFRVGADYRVNWRQVEEWMNDQAKSGKRK